MEVEASEIAFIATNFSPDLAVAYGDWLAQTRAWRDVGEPFGGRHMEEFFEARGFSVLDLDEPLSAARQNSEAEYEAAAVDRCFEDCGGFLEQLGDELYGWLIDSESASCY